MEGLLHNSMRAIWKAEKLVLQSITKRVDSQMVLGGINLLDSSEVREGNRKGTERTVTQWRRLGFRRQPSRPAFPQQLIQIQFLSFRQDLTMRGSPVLSLTVLTVPYQMNMTKVHISYVRKCHAETHCFVQIIVAHEGEKKVDPSICSDEKPWYLGKNTQHPKGTLSLKVHV